MRSFVRVILLSAAVILPACNCGNPAIENNQPPVVEIQSPSEGTVVRAGTALGLKATATDPEDGALDGAAVVWTSSVSGQLATGTTAQVMLTDLGAHTLTVTATDSGGATAGKTVQLTVIAADAPNVVIVKPANGATVALNEVVDFECAATTVDNQPIPNANIQWASALSGQLPPGAKMQAALSVAGSDTITCTATDPTRNASASATVQLTVSQTKASSLQITQPDTEEIWVKQGAPDPWSNTVDLKATATDPNQAGGAGNLDGSIRWTVEPGGTELGTGDRVTYTFTALGDYVVRASVTDSRGVTLSDQVTVHVVDNLPPHCEITRPDTDGTRYAQNFVARFEGACLDPESMATIAPTWTATLEPAPLGTGFTVQAALTAVGHQTLSACAHDPQSMTLKGCAHRAVNVFVNSAPTGCAIQAPTAGATINGGVPVPLKGSATDAEDPFNSLDFRWSSNVDGNLGGGADTTTVDLTTPGNHTLTLTVTDPWGLSCSATVSITVNGAPVVQIVSATQGMLSCFNGQCTEGADITTTGTASDPQGIANHAWTDSLTGAYGANATSATLAAPLPGKHMIVFTATDTLGAVGSAAREFSVLPTGKTQLVDVLANTGNDVLGIAETDTPGTLLFVDGQASDLWRFAPGMGVQSAAGLNDVGLSVFILGTGANAVVFAGTDGEGVARCSGNTCNHYLGGLLAPGGNVVNAVAASAGVDLLLVGTDNGLVVTRASDPSMGAMTNTVGGARVFAGARIRGLVLSPASSATSVKAWAATDQGLGELTVTVNAPFDPATATMTATLHQEPKIPDNDVSSVTVSPEGIVYAGTAQGVALGVDGSTVDFRAPPFNLPSRNIRAIAFERRSINNSPRDVLWAGTPDGLVRIDLGHRIPSRFTTADGLPSNDVQSVIVGANGVKYVGTAAGLARYDGP